MAETVILQELTTDVFSLTDTGYLTSQTGWFSLSAGETYRIRWDTEEHTCTAFAYEQNGYDCVFLGNENLVKGESTGITEPFVIYQVLANDYCVMMSTKDTEPRAHTVAIYQVVAEEEPEGIVLKDRNGKDVAYYGIETVTFDTTTEGKQQVYTKGVAVENLEIIPDFTGGDMAVTAAENTLVKSAVIKKPTDLVSENIRSGKEIGGISGSFIGDTEAVEVPLSMATGDQVVTPSAEGKVLSQVTVKKPETLRPENIADGVNIAGIIGSLAAGGVEVETGTFKGTDGIVRVNHALGVVPDIVAVFGKWKNNVAGTNKVINIVGVSTAFDAKYPLSARVFGYIRNYNSGTNSIYQTASFLESTGIALTATNEEITVGSSNYPTDSGYEYTWFAFIGLT